MLGGRCFGYVGLNLLLRLQLMLMLMLILLRCLLLVLLRRGLILIDMLLRLDGEIVGYIILPRHGHAIRLERDVCWIIRTIGCKGWWSRVEAGNWTRRSRVIKDTTRTVLAVWIVPARDRSGDIARRKVGLSVWRGLLP